MSPEQSGTTPSWFDAFLTIMRGNGQGPSFQVLSLLELVDEIRTWAQYARADPWRRPINHDSLLLEIDSAIRETSSWRDPATGDLLEEFRNAFRDGKNGLIGSVERSRILDAGDAIFEWTTRPQAIRALVERIIDGVKREDITARALTDMKDLLEDQLRAIGKDPRHVLMFFQSDLSAHRAHLSGIDDFDARLEDAITRLSAPAPESACVVWLSFSSARIRGAYLEAGPITFYRARSVVAAFATNLESSLPFLGELDETLQLGLSVQDDDDGSEIVIVRVDLGTRTPYGAIDDARSIVSAFVDVAAARSGGRIWRPRGIAQVLTGTAPQLGFSERIGGFDTSYGDKNRDRSFSWELEKWSAVLAPALDRKPLPKLLQEAMRLQRAAVAAANEDDFLSDRVRESSNRTAISLEDQVIEALSSVGNLSPQRFSEAVGSQWIVAQWHSAISSVVWSAIEIAKRNDPGVGYGLEQQLISTSNGSRVLMLGRVTAQEELLVAAFQGTQERNYARQVLSTLSNRDAFRTLEAALNLEGSLTASRHRRVRNAIVHGNPASASVISRVKGFSGFSSRAAIQMYLEAYVAEKEVDDHLGGVIAGWSDDRSRFLEGESWPEIWADGGDQSAASED